jgi:hypothetical protein
MTKYLVGSLCHFLTLKYFASNHFESSQTWPSLPRYEL